MAAVVNGGADNSLFLSREETENVDFNMDFEVDEQDAKYAEEVAARNERGHQVVHTTQEHDPELE